MCQSGHTNPKSFEKKFSLAEFFNAHWDSYVKAPKAYISKEQYKAVNALRLCRTAKLGKDVYSCKDCGNVVEIYHSCKNRFCPNCSWTDTLKWADRVYDKLLNLAHRHVVMTLPHALNPLIKRNRKFFFDTLISLASNTMKDYLLAKHGVNAGVISVLHTYGEKKNFHVHVHMIVSWGGINVKTGLLKHLPFDKHVQYLDLKETFRRNYLKALTQQYKSKNLKHEFADETDFEMFIRSLEEKPWIIHLEPPMRVPEQVIRYIGRYSKRACLSEYKITSIEGEYISFRYKEYKEKDVKGKPIEKELRLHYNDFFPLLLQHVPIPNSRLVRYYGLYSAKSKVAKEYKKKSQRKDSGQKVMAFTDTEICVECKGAMVYVETITSIGSAKWFIYRKKELSMATKKIAA